MQFFPILISLICLSFAAPIKGKVIAIKDGDTIEVLYQGKPLRVRLQGIDCPERNQDFGQKAKQFASDFCFNRQVEIVVFGKDRYGRTLGEVLLMDGRSLNQELVKAGLAWHYKAYSKDKVLADMEILARHEAVGLWVQPNPIAPWDFRKARRKVRTIVVDK